jgi:ABC-type oligopeptide transport system substrate-binding subunit
MKKLLTLGLSLLAVVAALSLSACGQQEETSQPSTGTEQPAQPSGGEQGSGAAPAAPAAPEGGAEGGGR